MDCYCNLIPVQFGSTLEKRSYFVDIFSRLFRSTWYELPEIVISCLNWKGKDTGDMKDKLSTETWKARDHENSNSNMRQFNTCYVENRNIFI